MKTAGSRPAQLPRANGPSCESLLQIFNLHAELAKRSQQRQGAQAELNDAPAQGIPSPVQSLKMGASMIL